MARIQGTSILDQTLFALWMLTLVSIGFVTAWILIDQHGSSDSRRPAFNLREL